MSRGDFLKIIILFLVMFFSHLNPFEKLLRNSQKRLITHHEHCLFPKHCLFDESRKKRNVIIIQNVNYLKSLEFHYVFRLEKYFYFK